MSFRLSKPVFIEGYIEWRNFLFFALFIMGINVGWHWLSYQKFISQKKIFTTANVLIQYEKTKNGKTYDVLKMQTQNGKTFYTTSREKIKDLRGRNLSVLLFVKRVGFLDYLTTPYISSAILRVNHDISDRMKVAKMINNQHRSGLMKQFYDALFLALPISKTLRNDVTLLGVNHLLALSGFHMGLLWVIVYGLLSLVYKPLQQRFFPWRNRLFDMGLVTILSLGGYLVFTGMPPSLLRAYLMVVVGWLALLSGVELLSFSFLSLCVVLLLALFPYLMFSVGFWLSVSGVFFIYLFLYWSASWNRWTIFVVMNIWVYLAMLPVVHAIFGTFSLYQLLSPLLTVLFIPFYPISILSHIVGFGGWLDSPLMSLLQWPKAASSVQVLTPWWVLIIFILTSIAAVRWRRALYIQIGLGGLWFFYLIEQVA